MFYEQRLSAPDTPEQLHAEYQTTLEAAIESAGLETAAAATDLDEERLEAVIDSEPLEPPLSLEEAAQIQALEDGETDAETIVLMATEHLLLGMSTAVLDVEALASELHNGLDPKEIQQKIERRAPMTFEEYVDFQYVIADRSP